ncbi:nitroreductase family protein [Novosphingobium profundi]|uniref:nitroreductase family protein n=1 Tax=Novosphingobium profundi TaxID=1774954 RepID=UPI001CFF4EA6|nr:nitroreductase family protein [Novosphingobium profundi]
MLLRLKHLAKSILAVGWVNKAVSRARHAEAEVFGSNRVLGHVLHALNPLPFNREQAAVMRGARNYHRNLRRDRRSHVQLRRNIHRLEKGLVMLPRRDVFATDYIAETMAGYVRAVAQFERSAASIDRDELAWAHDVLDAYFRACSPGHRVIDEARETFSGLPPLFPSGGKAPTRRGDRGASTITFDELRELSLQRRSVRHFEQRPVPRDLIDRALGIAAQAPTACNRMPYEFRIYDDPDLVRAVAQLPFGAAGFGHQIPTLAVVVGKLDSYFSARDRHAIYIDASLAAMSFLFALETLELSSTIINWPDFEPLEARMQRLLGLDLSERVVMLIAIGYSHPDAMVPYSQKKQLDSFRSYNKVGE